MRPACPSAGSAGHGLSSAGPADLPAGAGRQLPRCKSTAPAAADAFLAQWFAGQDHAEPPPGTRLRLVPCGTAAEKGLLPGFAVQGISLITEKGVRGWGCSAVVFAPRSFGSTDYEALYGSDFM